MQLLGRCEHKGMARFFTTDVDVCQECVDMGDTWVHLRMCMVCGKVGCCNDSKNKHAAAHYRADGHGLMRSIEPGEVWAYCYVDEKFLKVAEG
jgi:CPA2 family monovalent cation:H+ antiporter-2